MLKEGVNIMNTLLDTIAITWGIEDVKEVAKDLTDTECRQVLRLVKNKHDATIGVNWDVLEAWADRVREERGQ
jgi:hypothetical protein